MVEAVPLVEEEEEEEEQSLCNSNSQCQQHLP
jgi:hypothetical protein